MSKKINRRINGTFKRSLIYGVGVDDITGSKEWLSVITLGLISGVVERWKIF